MLFFSNRIHFAIVADVVVFIISICFHVVMVSCCHDVMLSCCHVVMVSCCHGVMLSWCHVVMVSCYHVALTGVGDRRGSAAPVIDSSSVD